MSKIITLKQAVEKNIVKQHDFFDYVVPHGKIIISGWMTGHIHDQVFETRKFPWRVSLVDGRAYLAAEDITKELTLYGKKGFANGTMAQDMVCRVFANQHASATFSMTEDMLQNCTRIKKPHWLGSPYAIDRNGYIVLGFRRASGEYVDNYKLSDSYCNRTYCLSYGVRPVVLLKSDTKIILDEEDGSKEYPWKFYEDSKELSRKEEIEKLLKEGEEIVKDSKEFFTKYITLMQGLNDEFSK